MPEFNFYNIFFAFIFPHWKEMDKKLKHRFQDKDLYIENIWSFLNNCCEILIQDFICPYS